jgi:L-histidine N-alpha-methyltransferase
VSIDRLALQVDFAEGESIHTESSYRFDLEGLTALADAAGFGLGGAWLDSAERFISALFLAR